MVTSDRRERAEVLKANLFDGKSVGRGLLLVRDSALKPDGRGRPSYESRAKGLCIFNFRELGFLEPQSGVRVKLGADTSSAPGQEITAPSPGGASPFEPVSGRSRHARIGLRPPLRGSTPW